MVSLELLAEITQRESFNDYEKPQVALITDCELHAGCGTRGDLATAKGATRATVRIRIRHLRVESVDGACHVAHAPSSSGARVPAIASAS